SPMAVTDTLINQVFDGRYKLVRKLGTGGMANVYLAEDQELDRSVAIKMLDERHAGDESFVERFRREAKNAAGLSHPNVVSIIGTAQYLSPEQARGAPVDPRSDLYSVGIVLYEMLTGSVPFTGDTPLEIAMKHLSTVPEPPSAKRPEVPHDLDMVVLRALAKTPDERYQSAEEMDADLARIMRGKGVSSATEEAATAILGGSGTTSISGAPTQIARPRPAAAPPGYAP